MYTLSSARYLHDIQSRICASLFPVECGLCSGMFLQLSSDGLNVCKKKKKNKIYLYLNSNCANLLKPQNEYSVLIYSLVTYEYILKNIGNQKVLVSIDFP